MESVAPVQSLLRLTELVRQSPPVRALFERYPDDAAVWRALSGDAAHASFRDAVAEHIERFGDRTVHELKLETPGLEENPAYVLGLCRAYLRTDRSVDGLERHEEEIRQAAEARVARLFGRRPARRWLFDFVLKQARATVRNRENTRLLRTQLFGMVKRIFRQIGQQFAKQGIIADSSDILYLAVEEITGYVHGAALSRSLRELVSLRRAEFGAYAGRELESRIVTRGIVYQNRFPYASAGHQDATGGTATELRGQGCSPGCVRGSAKVVLEPRSETAINGELLVAPMTDPGWVFLMVASRGLVVERGSPLSHTAIIGRELGIPTIVGVAGATRAIADGQQIEIDATRGIVRVLSAQTS
jgi:pyruvate,water dikinase